jgi:hypothetical protein
MRNSNNFLRRGLLRHRIQWWCFGLFEGCIQTIVTQRILLYHQGLINDGFIEDSASVVDRKTTRQQDPAGAH